LLRLRKKDAADTSGRIAKLLRRRARAIDAEIAKLRLFRELLWECVRVSERSPSRVVAVIDQLVLRGPSDSSR